MTLSIHDTTIPALARGLDVLSGLLCRGETHAEAAGHDSGTLIGARLAPDMLPLTDQVQRASDTARRFSGSSYVLTLVLRDFFFHVTTAYDILRHNDVSLGKRDDLWPGA